MWEHRYTETAAPVLRRQKRQATSRQSFSQALSDHPEGGTLALATFMLEGEHRYAELAPSLLHHAEGGTLALAAFMLDLAAQVHRHGAVVLTRSPL
jgi:hypothetical protein